MGEGQTREGRFRGRSRAGKSLTSFISNSPRT
jgi:hypothetical protein